MALLIDTLALILGFVLGTFLWATLVGGILASIPIQMKLKRHGEIEKVSWWEIIGSIVIAGGILTLAFIYLPIAFYASLVALIFAIFNIAGLRAEELSRHS